MSLHYGPSRGSFLRLGTHVVHWQAQFLLYNEMNKHPYTEMPWSEITLCDISTLYVFLSCLENYLSFLWVHILIWQNSKARNHTMIHRASPQLEFLLATLL